MLSSFLNKSPLKVVMPFKYSMGLVNMVEGKFMEIVFTNIQCGHQQSFRRAGEKNLPLKHGNTEKRLEVN